MQRSTAAAGGNTKNDSHMNHSVLLRNSIDSLHVLHVTLHVFRVRAREHHRQHLPPPSAPAITYHIIIMTYKQRPPAAINNGGAYQRWLHLINPAAEDAGKGREGKGGGSSKYRPIERECDAITLASGQK